MSCIIVKNFKQNNYSNGKTTIQGLSLEEKEKLSLLIQVPIIYQSFDGKRHKKSFLQMIFCACPKLRTLPKRN